MAAFALVKTKYKIILGALAALAVAYVISMIPTFRHRLEWQRTIRAFQNLPSERVDSAIQSFVAAQKAQGRSISKTVSLRELVAGGFLRTEDATRFEDVDVSFDINVDKNNPQQIIARVRLSSGLMVVELTDGSVQQITQSTLDRLDSQ